MNIFEAKRYLKKKGYRIIKESMAGASVVPGSWGYTDEDEDFVDIAATIKTKDPDMFNMLADKVGADLCRAFGIRERDLDFSFVGPRDNGTTDEWDATWIIERGIVKWDTDEGEELVDRVMKKYV